jgi:hypothetical protein
VLVEVVIQVDVDFTRPDDQVVGSRLHKVQQLKGVRLDFVCVSHIPHEEALREDKHGARQPVVVHEELPILQAVDFHSFAHSFTETKTYLRSKAWCAGGIVRSNLR